MGALNNAQRELLKIFHEDQSEEELQEIKQLLSEYLAKRLIDAVDKESKERGYTLEVMASWKDEHFRTPYK